MLRCSVCGDVPDNVGCSHVAPRTERQSSYGSVMPEPGPRSVASPEYVPGQRDYTQAPRRNDSVSSDLAVRLARVESELKLQRR
jgi:hypothetical protein